jgi:hypothetical protein
VISTKPTEEELLIFLRQIRMWPSPFSCLCINKVGKFGVNIEVKPAPKKRRRGMIDNKEIEIRCCRVMPWTLRKHKTMLYKIWVDENDLPVELNNILPNHDPEAYYVKEGKTMFTESRDWCQLLVERCVDLHFPIYDIENNLDCNVLEATPLEICKACLSVLEEKWHTNTTTK